MQNAKMYMCSAMCCACELRRAIHTTHVRCGCGLRCGVAFACGAASVPVAVVCIVAARVAMARMRLCRGKEFSDELLRDVSSNLANTFFSELNEEMPTERACDAPAKHPVGLPRYE